MRMIWRPIRSPGPVRDPSPGPSRPGLPTGPEERPERPQPPFGAVGFHKANLVRAEGLEPPRAKAHWLLRPACLPVPPRPLGCMRTALDCKVMDEMASTLGRNAPDGVIVTHPNRDKPAVIATRATVVLLLIVSAALLLIVTIGGWSTLEGDIPILLVWVIVYFLMA